MTDFLLPLKLAGSNSAAVESFASYFARLAYTHAISRSQLTRVLGRRFAGRHGGVAEICEAPVYATHGAGLFGYRATVEAYIELVEDASSVVDLRRSTLIPIRESLASQCIGSVKSVRSWCAACWGDDMRAGYLPYDRFLWSLAPIRRCHLHRLALRETCPSCGALQKFHHRSGHPGLCVKCGNSLVGGLSDGTPVLEPDFGEVDCIELVAAIATGTLVQTRPDSQRIFEEELTAVVSPVAEVLKGVSKPSGTALAQQRLVKPSLTTLLKKAFASGVGVVDILLDPVQAAKVAGQLFYDRGGIPAEMRNNYSEKMRLHVHRVLLEHLGKPGTEQIPSLKALANELGVPCNYIRGKFPSLLVKYISHQRSANFAAIARRYDAAKRELLSLVESGQVKSFARLKHLEAHLAQTTGCTVRQARRVIAATLKRDLHS